VSSIDRFDHDFDGGPDGDILGSDGEIGTEGFDIANVVDTVAKLPLKVLE